MKKIAPQEVLKLKPKRIFRGIHTRFLTICKYEKDVDFDIAKNRLFPHLRGTWLPSFDIQDGFGIAINWLGIRIRIST